MGVLGPSSTRPAALPIGLLVLLGWLAGRAVRRRQRESALA
jgi:hypothetical protein